MVVLLTTFLSVAEFVVSQVADSLRQGNYSKGRDVAFIYRTNAQSRALEEACVKKSLPYVIFGSATSFYKRQEIRDCLCFLQWLHNGRDRNAMLRAFVTPRRGIGDAAIEQFEEYCEQAEIAYQKSSSQAPVPTPLDVLLSFASGNPVVSGLTSPSEFFSKRPLNLFTQFASKMLSFRELAETSSLDTVLNAIIAEMELIDHIDKISKSKAEFEERKMNVEELVEATKKFRSAGPSLVRAQNGEDGFVESPLSSFLDDVALVTDLSESSREESFVAKLMTIHASKGMEFDTVFAVGNEDGTLPTSQVRFYADLSRLSASNSSP